VRWSVGLAVLSLGARWNKNVRALVLRPEASMQHVQLGLDFFAAVGGLLALAFLATAISLVRGTGA